MTSPYIPQTWVNGPDGNTPVSASRLNYMEAGIAAASLGGTEINVRAHGAVGDGTTDDTAAIQAAIAAAAPGDTVWFPAGTYLVTSTIVFPGRIVLRGAAGIGAGTTIRAGAGLTDAVLASAAWFNNATTCDTPVQIEGLEIDGANVGAGVRGIVLLAFWSRIRDVQIRNMTGHGIELNDRTRNGTNVITNSASENTIIDCRFEDITGDAVHQESNNGIANLDGHIVGCFFSTITGHGVNLGRGAGWVIDRCHMYGMREDAIRVTDAYAAIITGNYIEDFGVADVAGESYVGINLVTILNGRASIVANNTVSTQAPGTPTGNRWTCFYARAGGSQMRAMLVLAGNTAMFADGTPPTTPRSHAFRLGEGNDTGRLLQVEWAGNQIEQTAWWEQTRVVNAGVDLREPGRSGTVTLTDAATVTIDASRGKLFRLTAAGNRTLAAPTNPVDGQGMVIAHTASGAARTLTLTTGTTGAFAFGADVAGLTATAVGTTDYIGCIYDAISQRWRVVSYAKGY